MENLTGGTPPVRYLLCVVPCKLYFLLLVKVIWLLGNVITNIISYAIGFLLLIIGGCAIYCIVKAMWISLAMLIGMGMAVYLFLFLLVWSVVKAENIGNALGAFIRS